MVWDAVFGRAWSSCGRFDLLGSVTYGPGVRVAAGEVSWADADVTGDISVHEMAWASGELDRQHPVLLPGDARRAPQLRPALATEFVTELAADDRRHLNGMAIVDGRPTFVTAMGMTNERQRWERDKVDGGVLLKFDSGPVVAQDLTMPHSPRWHDGRLWVLDSGRGSLATVDMETGDVSTVIRLPGFTRGLACIGRNALVGLSKVREHVFAGLPLAEHVAERKCGVWVVDTVAQSVVGLVRFETGVEEIFDVQVLAGVRYPEILEPRRPGCGWRVHRPRRCADGARPDRHEVGGSAPGGSVTGPSQPWAPSEPPAMRIVQSHVDRSTASNMI